MVSENLVNNPSIKSILQAPAEAIEGTKKYRQSQFNKLSTIYSEYKTKIKIIKPDGETNWLDIEPSELEAIKAILTA